MPLKVLQLIGSLGLGGAQICLKYLVENNKYIDMGNNAEKYFHKKHDVISIIQLYKEYFTQLLKSKVGK